MQNDFPGNDPKTVWQNQATKLSTMTLETMGQKARELEKKTRRELFGSISSAAIAVVISGGGIVYVHDLGLRALFALALAWAVAGQYFLHRGMWSAPRPGDAGSSTGLEFYRWEIKRRTWLFRRVLQWNLGPVVLSVCALILALAGIANMQGVPLRRIIPFCAMFAFWMAAVFAIRWRGQRDLRREIEELEHLRK